MLQNNQSLPATSLVDICLELKSINSTCQSNIGLSKVYSQETESKHRIMELALEAAENMKISDLDQISVFNKTQCQNIEDTWVDSVLEQHAFLRLV